MLILFYFLLGFVASAQVEIIGRVFDHISGDYLQGVRISFDHTPEWVFTDKGGYFKIKNISEVSGDLKFELKGYKNRIIPLELRLTLEQLDLGSLTMSRLDETSLSGDWIELSELETGSDHLEIENVAGLLNAGKDLFSRTAAYDFGSNFFRPRFLGSEHGTVMLNGVSLNKLNSGRPEWSNWGGLNDALRKQERYDQMQSSPYNLGGLAHGINMISVASEQRENLKTSIALSNKNYQSRIMTTYSSGSMKNGWAYMFSASLRYADNGYRSGTNYKAYSFLASVDKQLNAKQNLNLTLIYAFNEKGKSSPMTQEVFELKNVAYNSYWGNQQNQSRNSRQKRILEPIFQINHQYKINERTSIHSHFTYQFGTISSSRLDYGGGRLLKDKQIVVGGGMNPDPTYYQRLPSYFLKDSSYQDYGRAYLAEKDFKENGQIDWPELYEANTNSPMANYSVYALFDDRRDNRFWVMNSGFTRMMGSHISLNGTVSLVNFSSKNYAYMSDLLGGKGYLDVDSFAQNSSLAQNNLQNPNRVVFEKEKFRYNYELEAREARVYLNANYSSKQADAYFGAEYVVANYQRNGIFENGAYPGALSYGKSKKMIFQSFAFKAGFLHKFNGRHMVFMKVNYLEKPPVIDRVFANVRVSNEPVIGLTTVSNLGIELKYNWRHQNFNASLSGYYLRLDDGSKISFYYADGLTGIENEASSAFVQEVLTGINKQNTGLEFSLEVPLFINFKLKGVAAIGRSVYASNPELYLNSNTFEGSMKLGKSYLKGYYASGGPQHAFSIGFEYSSPKYWWLSTSLNYFDKSFISVAPITRTRNFILDSDGLPIHNLDSDLAKELLHQESLQPYININLVGGKSWKIKNWYIGLFSAINNLSNSFYKTGGFEQSRTANYLTLKEDKLRAKPLFGPKYWFGFGTTFFTSIYFRI